MLSEIASAHNYLKTMKQTATNRDEGIQSGLRAEYIDSTMLSESICSRYDK